MTKEFVKANDASPVVEGWSNGKGGEGGTFRLEDGRMFFLSADECAALPEGYPKWKLPAKKHYTAAELKERKVWALDWLDMLEGRGRYHGDMGNFCYADGIFANSIKREFECNDLTKLRKWAST